MTSRWIRTATLALLLVVGVAAIDSAWAANDKTKDNNGLAKGHSKKAVAKGQTKHAAAYTGPRSTVVVHQGFPIRRSWPMVVVREPVRPIRVSAPSTYLPVSNFNRNIYSPYVRQTSWQDSDTFRPGEDWVSTTLNVDAYGRRLFLSVGGRAQIAFAEVVFENGEARVVDFNDRDVRSGRYLLLEFPDGRRVDHVRVVARARGERATLNLFLES